MTQLSDTPQAAAGSSTFLLELAELAAQIEQDLKEQDGGKKKPKGKTKKSPAWLVHLNSALSWLKSRSLKCRMPNSLKRPLSGREKALGGLSIICCSICIALMQTPGDVRNTWLADAFSLGHSDGDGAHKRLQRPAGYTVFDVSKAIKTRAAVIDERAELTERVVSSPEPTLFASTVETEESTAVGFSSFPEDTSFDEPECSITSSPPGISLWEFIRRYPSVYQAK